MSLTFRPRRPDITLLTEPISDILTPKDANETTRHNTGPHTSENTWNWYQSTPSPSITLIRHISTCTYKSKHPLRRRRARVYIKDLLRSWPHTSGLDLLMYSCHIFDALRSICSSDRDWLRAVLRTRLVLALVKIKLRRESVLSASNEHVRVFKGLNRWTRCN